MDRNPVALVTGCSTGIGYETALLLARNGYRVFATMRDLRKAEPLRSAASGLPLEILPLDVDDPSSVRKAVALVARRAGRIDCLVNNAGWGAFGAVGEFTDREILSQFETNVFGPMRVLREVLPWMRRGGGGRILQVGSLAGRMTFAGIGLYCATKHAVEAMTESLRLELGPSGVQTAVVEPGSIRTPFKVNRRLSESFAGGRSVHRMALENVLRYGNRPKGPGPDLPARVILKALSSLTLRTRYGAGWDALLFPLARWFMPDALYDRLTTWAYRRFDPSLPAFRAPRSTGRTVLVTGATSGIGLATARLLARRGWRVWAGYRNPRTAAALREGARDLPIFPILLDVDRTGSVKKAVAALLRKEGRMDAVVNNAGFVSAGFWEDQSDADLRAQFETNVFGLLRVCRETLPALRAQGGRIVNLGSVSGFSAYPVLGPYSATKFCVRALTEALRMEEGPRGVQVTEIAPGLIRTNIVQAARKAYGNRKALFPMRGFLDAFEADLRQRMAQAPPPEHVAELIGRALEAKRTRRFYLVDPGSRLTYLLKWFLPDAWWEALVRRAYSGNPIPDRREGKARVEFPTLRAKEVV